MILTPHFSFADATCNDGTPLPVGLYFNALRVAEAAEVVRAVWQLPLTVTSWYRTAAYNQAVNGGAASMHLWALAMDLKPPAGIDVQDFWDVICELTRQTTIRGIGFASRTKGNFVHIDCRPGEVVRHWRYGDNGRPS